MQIWIYCAAVFLLNLLFIANDCITCPSATATENIGAHRIQVRKENSRINSVYKSRKSWKNLTLEYLNSFLNLLQRCQLLLKIFVLSKESRSFHYWSLLIANKKGEMRIERFSWNLNILLIFLVLITVLTQNCQFSWC